MELIVHPTIQQKKEISYNHILKLNENLDIYVGNEHSREAEHFNYIIQLCNENEYYPQLSYKPIDILTLKFNDIRTNDILKHRDIIKEFIDKCSGTLLIHCGEGISRSPSILIMYLIYCYNYKYMDAYNFVSTKRFIKPNIGFVKQLRSI